MKTTQTDGYLPVLDGLRAVCMLLIFFFHDWQQTWLSANFHIGGRLISLEPLQRHGYIAIDAFFVMSGFCLFYPVARNMFGEVKSTSLKQFYIKRIRRILPSYYLMLILLMIFPVLSFGNYNPKNPMDLIRHFGSHALFLHIYNADTLGSTISTAWTLGIETAFYVFFPLIAELFKRKPVLTFSAMLIFSQSLRLIAASAPGVTILTMANPLLYIDIFGWGMLSAYAVAYTRHKMPYINKSRFILTAVSVLCIAGIYLYVLWLGRAYIEGQDSSSYHRLLYRTILSGLFAAFIYSASYSVKAWQSFWGNGLFRFLSGISYSFYLWHQNIHIALRRLNIPYTSANPVMNDKRAMVIFMLLSFFISLTAAVFSTYCIEKPIIKYGFCGCFNKIRKKH